MTPTDSVVPTPAASTPHLAAPGAGLPWLELQVARLMFSWLSACRTRESAAAVMEDEAARIIALAEGCTAQAGASRVLIRRLPGMEDSSRFWSVYMTVQHLRIVNTSVAEVIVALGCGECPARVASTAAVKPVPEAGPEEVDKFHASCRSIAAAVESLPSLRTPTRYAHPWFGPLDAAGWHFMAGFHMQLHTKQIRAIVKQLPQVR